MTTTKIEEASLEYQNASALLNAYVANTIQNYQNVPIVYDTLLINDYGAFQNGKVAAADPGGFAHNSYYVKRLIFDSIDWLDGDNWDTTGADPVAGMDGNNLDGIINIDVGAYAKAAAWLGAADTEDLTAVPPVAVGDANRPAHH
jgi:hypothetical protein